MRISELKTVISSLSEQTNWSVEGIGPVDFSFSDSVAFTYLGVSVKVRGRDFLCSQYQRIKMKADGYMHAILQTTKDSIDRALVVRSVWLFCAVPSIMYGAEACVLGKSIFKELDKKQRVIASLITGMSSSGGNSALALESGLMGFEARYNTCLHRYFNRALVSKSKLIEEALWEHSMGPWVSPYQAKVNFVIKKYGLQYMNSNSSKARILDVEWEELLKDVYSLKSLKN